MEKIILSRARHREKEVVKAVFPKDQHLIELFRELPGATWSKTMRSWYVSERSGLLKELFGLFKGVAFIDYSALKNGSKNTQQASGSNREPATSKDLSDEVRKKIQEFSYWLRSRRYSESTVKTYTDGLRSFLKFYSDKPVSEINNNDVIVYNNDFILKHKLSASYQNQVVNAIKLFFRTIENTTINIDVIHRPKRPKLLPNVLSKEEVKLILNAHSNLKHKAMLSLIYSCGLRCGELLRLQPEHIDSKRNVLIIKQAKGRKDRIAPLSNKIVEMLRQYYVAYKPGIYLFEGQTKGHPYDERSLQQVLKQSLEKVKITKPVSLHWLRHSYATHLLENGTDLRYIQEILGHNSSKTTEIYTHVSTKNIQKIVSPFDYL